MKQKIVQKEINKQNSIKKTTQQKFLKNMK